MTASFFDRARHDAPRGPSSAPPPLPRPASSVPPPLPLAVDDEDLEAYVVLLDEVDAAE